MMKRTSVLFGLAMVLGFGAIGVAPAFAAKKAPKKTEAKAEAPAAAPAAAADSADIDQKLADARDERDRSLDAASGEKDPAKLEQKKREIFAKYAAICAALRDAAAKGDVSSPPADPAPAKAKAAKPAKGEPAKAEAKPAKPAGDSLDDLKSKLAAIDSKLSDLTAQHDSKLQTLQQKLDDAKTGGKPKAIEKAQGAVDKENAAYGAKKSDLDAQKSDLQNQIDALSPPAK